MLCSCEDLVLCRVDMIGTTADGEDGGFSSRRCLDVCISLCTQGLDFTSYKIWYVEIKV